MKSALEQAKANMKINVISEVKETNSESMDAEDIPDTLEQPLYNILDGMSPENRPVKMLFKAKSFNIKGFQRTMLDATSDDEEEIFGKSSSKKKKTKNKEKKKKGAITPRAVPKMGRTHSIHTTTGFFATTIMKKIEKGNSLDISAINVVKENIGRGADAFVHYARYNQYEIALKHYKFKPQDFNDERLSSFENELNILKRFKHHNVVHFLGYHLNINQKCLNFAFEYTSGGNLFSKIHPIGPKADYPFHVTLRILIDIAKGMEHIHSKHVIHRDLNPRNVLIFKDSTTQSVRYCVTDFGESLLIDADDDFETPTIRDKNSVGSAAYKAPEIIQINRSNGLALYNYKVDVFSFGSMCYEVYSKAFVSGEASLKEYEQMQSNEWVVLIPDDCPDAFGQLLWECWQFEPDERPNFSQIVLKLAQMLEELKREEAKMTAIKMTRQHSESVRRQLTFMESQDGLSFTSHPDMLQLEEEDEKESDSFSAISFGDDEAGILSPTAHISPTQASADMGRPLNAHDDFGDDQRAFETWTSCCDQQDETFGYYVALYPLLSEIFLEKSKCSRIPTQMDFEICILKQGGRKILISKLHKMNVSGMIQTDYLGSPDPDDMGKPGTSLAEALQLSQSQSESPDTSPKTGANSSAKLSAKLSVDGDDTAHRKKTNSIFNFDNPQSDSYVPRHIVTMRYKVFYKFWKWFLECCAVIGECSFLWELNKRLGCDLFMSSDDAAQILQKQPMGTFVIRISHSITGRIHVDYCEPADDIDIQGDDHDKSATKHRPATSLDVGKAGVLKHVMLTRRAENQYEVESHHDIAVQDRKLTTLSAFIRSFVKIKYLYTMKDRRVVLYPKKSCFKPSPPRPPSKD